MKTFVGTIYPFGVCKLFVFYLSKNSEKTNILMSQMRLIQFLHYLTALYRKGLVYLDCPINDDDCIIGEGFSFLLNPYKQSCEKTCLWGF